MIKIINLTQKRGDAVVLDNINLQIRENTSLGIIGDKNSGKTTLTEVLAGALDITDGTVEICGKDISLTAKAANLGYVPEHIAFYGNMTVIEYLTFIAEIKGVPYDSVQQSVKDALTATGLVAIRNNLTSVLNAYGRARLGLAQAILSNPDVLLLDCPASGLCGEDAENLLKLITTLSQSRTLFITSRDTDITSICDEILTLSSGKLEYNCQDDKKSSVIKEEI